MNDTQTESKNWRNELQSKITSMAEQFDLDPLQAQQFREGVLGICKEEYKAGNKSGIKWAFKKAAEKQGGVQVSPA
jgi:hypothetical protein